MRCRPALSHPKRARGWRQALPAKRSAHWCRPMIGPILRKGLVLTTPGSRLYRPESQRTLGATGQCANIGTRFVSRPSLRALLTPQALAAAMANSARGAPWSQGLPLTIALCRADKKPGFFPDGEPRISHVTRSRKLPCRKNSNRRGRHELRLPRAAAYSNKEDHQGRPYQQDPRDDEGFEICAERDPQHAARVSCGGATELVNDHNPSDHDPDSLGTDSGGKQAHRRSCAGEPVKAVHDAEQRQAIDRHVESERQIEQRKAAQSIVAAQKQSVVPAVAEPTGKHSSKERKNAGRGQQVGSGHRAQSVIDAGRNEMRADETIGRGSAHEITASY